LEGLSLRQFKESDIEFAYESTVIEGWNYTKEYIVRMFSYNSLGCFIAEIEGKRAGHVFSVKYGKLGWIGLLIVRTEHRGKGVGTLLMKRVMEHLLNCGVETIKLEAVLKIANLYRRLGFADEYDSARFSGNIQKITTPTGSNVKLMKKDKIKEIAEFDAKYFGANRLKVLTKLIMIIQNFVLFHLTVLKLLVT
jgi:GNAT superfamily N-acetyltransferase